MSMLIPLPATKQEVLLVEQGIALFGSCFYDYLLCYFLDEVVAHTAHLTHRFSFYAGVGIIFKQTDQLCCLL